jgi:hypothetical protein
MVNTVETEAGNDGREFVHWVNPSDRIIEVNQAWRDFARENGSAQLADKMETKPSLWDFITGRETRYLFEVLLSKVRRGKGPFTLPFRCDAPDRRRYMELTVRLCEGARVEMSSRMLREERRQPVPLLADDVLRSDRVLYCCSWCKKFEVPSGNWEEVEGAIKELDLFGVEKLPVISHGACPDCAHKIEELGR